MSPAGEQVRGRAQSPGHLGEDSQREGHLDPSAWVPSLSSDASHPQGAASELVYPNPDSFVPVVNPPQLKGHRTQVHTENSWIAVIDLHNIWGFIFNSLKL